MDTECCSRCGHPDRAVHEIVSRHATSDGLIVYSRCRCGRLQVRRESQAILEGTVVLRERT